MTVDFSKIKPGDEVPVRAFVQAIERTQVFPVRVAPRGAGHNEATLCFSPDDIVSHTPREIQVGDKVRIGFSNPVGEVVGVYEGKAWVKQGCRGPLTFDIASLERIP